jgi:transketolase
MVYANRINGVRKKIIVMLGDGELQEGQIWEALPGAARDMLDDLVVIVDANGIQSDSWVSETLDLGDIGARIKSFGWNFLECKGNSVESILTALKCAGLSKKPTWIQAQTTKGYGVSFMEEFPTDGSYYQFHSGAPNSIDYKDAIDELRNKLELNYKYKNENETRDYSFSNRKSYYEPQLSKNSVVFQYASMLKEIVDSNKNIIVLDSDLSKDTGTFLVKKAKPNNYIQCGIAEQDMVSIAGGLALNNFVPIVHSFGTFLTMRGYEQIFNNSTECKTIIYVGFLAGILPSMPGVSHQAVTDFPIMSAIPNMMLYEPSSLEEVKMSFSRAIKYKGPSYIRMQSVGDFSHANDLTLKKNECLTIWKEFKTENAIICSGATMLDQVIQAAKLLEMSGHFCNIITIFDYNFSQNIDCMKYLEQYNKILVIENYLPGNFLFSKIKSHMDSNGKKLSIGRLGISEFPKSGQNIEVLKYYKLDAKSIAEFYVDSESWN